MTAILNQPPAPPVPVQCNFYFKQEGPLGSVTYDGDIYPYTTVAGKPLAEGDTRYLLYTTPVRTPVAFDAVGKENIKNPHVVPPPGVEILEYIWDFGDGSQGYGPVVTHTFKVVDPDIEVTLTVIDSRGLRFSCAKPVNLIGLPFGFIVPFKIRGENATSSPNVKRIASPQPTHPETAVTIEGRFKISAPVMRIAAADIALTNDLASVTHDLANQAFDTALAVDVATRSRLTGRTAAETSVTVDVTTRSVGRSRTTTDTAVSVDVATMFRRKIFEATLSFTGQARKAFTLARKFVATLTSAGSLTPFRENSKLLDTFVRANEAPLSNGGTWVLINGCKTTGEIEEKIEPPEEPGEDYTAKTAFVNGEDGAYWSPQEFTEPSVKVEINEGIKTNERFLALYACLSKPGEATKTGYRLKMIRTAENKYAFVIQKSETGTFASIAEIGAITVMANDHVRLSVQSGKVTGWTKKPGGSWTEILSVTDSKYTKGFVGIGAKGTSTVHARYFEVT